MNRRAHLSCLAVCTVAGTIVPAARATTLNWMSAVSGNASTAANWNPAQVPTSADLLIFNVGGPTNSAYSVTFDTTLPQSGRISVGEDVVTLNLVPSHTTGEFRVGIDATPSPAAIISGTLHVSSLAQIGSTANSVNATVVLNSVTSRLNTTGGSGLQIGAGGQGQATLTNGGVVSSASDIILGNSAGSSGAVTMTGSLAPPTTIQRSLLSANSPGGDIIVGNQGGGSLQINTLARAECAQDFVIAQSATSTGNTVVNGGAISVGRNLMIGGNALNTAAGNGTLSTTSTVSTIDVQGSTTVGDVNGGAGLLHLNGGTLTTQAFSILAGGTFDFDAGTLVVDGGAFSNGSTQLLVDSASANPTLELRGAQSNAFTASPMSIAVGNTGSGSLVLRDGRSLSGSGGSVTIGDTAGSSGAVTVDSGAVLNAGNSFFFVGRLGTGTLNVTGGAQVHAANTVVAGSAAATGSIAVSGAGSLFAANNLGANSIDLGINTGTNANLGPASLTISNGATVTASGNITTGGSDDSITITNGTLNAALLEVRGSAVQALTMTNGTINAAECRIVNASATLSGTINARLTVGAGTSVLTLNGDLTAGDAASNNGIYLFCQVNVGAHNLVLRDHDGASIGNVVTLAGGSIRCDPSIGITASSSISGFGTFHSPVFNSGSISATGTGLTFNALLSGVGTGISGTRITLGSSGGFTGSGTIAAEVAGAVGSVITATGPLTMGNAASTNGVSSLGLLVVGANTVTLRDASTAIVSDVTMNGGSLVHTTSSTILISSGGTVSGSGNIQATLFLNHSTGTRVTPNGQITVQGAYDQSNGAAGNFGGTLEINMTSVAGFDRLAVTGNAELGGTLEGGLVPGGTMNVGDRVTFLTCASRTGTFRTVNVPGFHVEYFSNRVDLVFDGLPCDPDMNQDGNVDQDDVVYLINVIGGGANISGADPDFNRDGNADQDDVVVLIGVIAGADCP